MSKLTLSAASRVGCVRSNNEDMVLAFNKMIRGDAYQTEFTTESNDRFAIAVADGMGGHRAGEVASEITLENLQFFLHDIPRGLASGEFHEHMLEWLKSINAVIESRGYADPALRDMGTTLVAIVYYGGKFYWLNCGDSRLYRLRDNRLVQMSTDHSLNSVTGEKRHSNVITNCIGGGCKHSYMDLFEFTADVLPGDCYLLCSDGLNDMVHDDVIERLLCDGATANGLCEAAIEAGGYDNVSACVVRVDK